MHDVFLMLRSIKSLNSVGSIEHTISGPFLYRVSVKCFSMIFAPSAHAAIDIVVPIEWSEKPTIALGKCCLISVIADKRTVSGGVG